MDSIIVATTKEWNIKNYFFLVNRYKRFNFYLMTKPEELTYIHIKALKPKYIFFPHWSWIIEEAIYVEFECIVFHMTDLPFGRGGSPLQNLIHRDIKQTKISAIRVTKELDAGAIYMKEILDISVGSAEEIYMKASNLIFDTMIPKFLSSQITPKEQCGEIVQFARRTPDESEIIFNNELNLERLYNFIRMLDAEGYPKAYINLGKIRIEFSEVHLKNSKLAGRFEVIEYE